MQISKNICIFSLDSLDAANFEDFFLIKSNYTYFFLRKTQLNNKMFTQSKCPISRQEHDFLIVNLELVPVSLRNLLIFAENKSDFDNFLHRLIKGSSYAKVTENSEIAKPKDINEIHLAAYTGNISLLKEIIAQDATIDAVDSNGYSPLDLALATSNFSAAKILIDNGVECQSKTFPLLSLARFNFLQSNGCDLAQEIKYFPQQTLIYLSLKIGEICDDGYALFLEAILISGNNIILKEYIKHIKINVYELLYFSVLHNLHNSLKFILNTNSIDINKKRKKTKHQSLLHMACKNGDIETTKILLDHKGDIGCKDYNLSTPLHLACKSNNIELILFLIKKGANIKALSLNDFTPLHQAICASNFDVVKILTENGANIHAKTKNDLSTMYMSVTRFNYNPSQQTLIASYLLSKGFIADSEVIALAFDRRATAVLAVLMEHSSITGEIIDSEGLIFKAINNDMIDILPILLKKTKNINREFLAENETALQIALYKNNFDMVDLLIRNGAAISSLDKSLVKSLYETKTTGWTAMHADALYNKKFDVIKIINKNIDPNHCATQEGTTPLHIATATSNDSFIEAIQRFTRPLLPFWQNSQLKIDDKENKANTIKYAAYKTC